MAAEKTDFKRALKSLYAPERRAGIHAVTVPPMRFLMIDGKGDPNGPAFGEAVAALYSVAYPLKFASKQQLGQDYVVPPLEALWDADDIMSYARGERAEWRWSAMLMVPDWVTDDLIEAAFVKARSKGEAPLLDAVRVKIFDEGRALQALHIGPYAAEAPLIAAMHAEAGRLGLALRGRHHEIYLSDPRKSAPEKMKTVLRQPVEGGA